MNNLKKLGLALSSCLLFAPFALGQERTTLQDSGALPSQGSQEVTFSGVGQSDKDFDNGGFSFEGSYGVYYTDRVLLSVRQTMSDLGDGDNWSGSTLLAADYHFLNGAWRPFLGLNAGLRYGGDDVGDDFSAGAQAGLKYYIQNDAFLFARADYGYTFDNVDDVEDAWDSGRFGYGFGVGLNF